MMNAAMIPVPRFFAELNNTIRACSALACCTSSGVGAITRNGVLMVFDELKGCGYCSLLDLG